MKPFPLKRFIPICGNYYHLITGTALTLYEELRRNNLQESLDCQLWYQGGYPGIIELFSCRPIIHLPITKPYMRDMATISSEIETLEVKQLGEPQAFQALIPLSAFLGQKIPAQTVNSGITLIKRVNRREHAEASELAVSLQQFGLPVRVAKMENLSFAEQVNVMRATKVLIAPHGAGTTNQMFMPAGGIIIEMFPKGYVNWHASAMAKVFSHDLTMIESEAAGVFGRPPTDEVKVFLEKHGWTGSQHPARRKCSREFARVMRDVRQFSIPSERIIAILKSRLDSFQ